MKNTIKLLIISLMVISAFTLVTAQEKGSYTLETISIGDSENIPEYKEEKKIDDNGNTIIKKTGKYPSADSIRKSLKKGASTGIGVVKYNETENGWKVNYAHLFTVTAISSKSKKQMHNGKEYSITNIQVYDPTFDKKIDTTMWEGNGRTFLHVYNDFPIMEDQMNIWKNNP